MNIFLREMKAHRKSLIIWSIGVFMMVASGMNKFGGFEASGISANELMAKMPKAMQTLMGTGSFDLSKANEYYGTLYIYLLLIGTIHAVTMGANILSKEERDKTSEFLFVKPVTRTLIIGSKLGAALTNIVVINLVTMLSSTALVHYYSKGEEAANNDIFLLMAGMFILQLLFLSVGMTFAAVKKNSKASASIATGILLLTYILSIAIDLNEKLEAMKYFTPFKYFEAKNIMFGGGLDALFVAISFAMIAALVLITFIFYKKRDLNG